MPCSRSCASRAGGSLLGRSRRKPRLDLAAPAELVDEVDGLVLAVAADDAEPHPHPPPEAEAPLLGDRPREDDRAALDLVIGATSLPHAADEDLEVVGHVVRQVNPRALGHL